MKKFEVRSLLAFLLAAMMVFTMIPYTAFAADTGTSTADNSISLSLKSWVNPDYRGLLNEEDLYSGGEPFVPYSSETTYLESVKEGGTLLREYMVNRVDSFMLNYKISIDEANSQGDAWLQNIWDGMFEEACKMIVCAMDYELVADGKGGYPAGYVLAAARMGITSGTVGKAISYGDAYDMLFNAMIAELPSVDYVDGKGEILYKADGDESILTEYWDIYRAEGTVETLCGMSINSSTVGEKNEVIVGGRTYKFDGVCNLEPLFGGYAEVFYQKTKKDALGTIIFARKKSSEDDVEIKPEHISMIKTVKLRCRCHLPKLYITEDFLKAISKKD